jgi:hypothetical protein
VLHLSKVRPLDRRKKEKVAGQRERAARKAMVHRREHLDQTRHQQKGRADDRTETAVVPVARMTKNPKLARRPRNQRILKDYRKS